ncbi:uncharacterized protein N7458_000114 [Penicillium daleae]|uniref:Translin-associated protein X n=1 Tax=Penicillium daleae TaxID=63821 RepID=A0AAD6G750_9EURO|nr:uncharacterized protein N7458_000114 [Penicillium daleae]KAJ5464428.1 hypothetical protein N7458_000114 [Penicillium daleae]
MGTKRSWEGQAVVKMDSTESASPTISIFENFRDELDEHHDRRERIIKASRDITALSKKIIFALQRVRTTGQPIPPNITQENDARLEQIHKHFASIVTDLVGIKSCRYQRQISGGVQEFIEAISFDHYLRTETLITHAEVVARLPGILVTEEDYLMGIFDLTGEMMRFAVTALSSGKVTPTDAAKAGVLVDLRAIRARCEALSVPGRHRAFMYKDLAKKKEVMQNSVEKVERAAYGILVRGSERPSGWTPDLSAPVEVDTH